MNEIEKQLRAKIGDTTAAERRIQQRVLQREKSHKKSFRIWWAVPLVVLGALLFVTINMQKDTAMNETVVQTKTMTNLETGETKQVTENFYDELLQYANNGKETALYFTPSAYFDGFYVTTKCGEPFCELVMGMQQTYTDHLAAYGKAAVVDEQLSPDKKLLLTMLNTNEGQRLVFIDVRFLNEPPEMNEMFHDLVAATWQSNTKLLLQFKDGHTKTVTIPRNDVKGETT